MVDITVYPYHERQAWSAAGRERVNRYDMDIHIYVDKFMNLN